MMKVRKGYLVRKASWTSYNDIKIEQPFILIDSIIFFFALCVRRSEEPTIRLNRFEIIIQCV